MLEKKNLQGAILRCFYIFFVFAVLGWLYEMSLFFFYNIPDEIYNRGFLLGPYLPIYGFGGLLIVYIKEGLEKAYPKDKKLGIAKEILLSFILVVFLATSLELISSYLLDFLKLEKLWDYSNFKYNFQGRISLRHSFRFGLGGLFFLYIVLPILDKLILHTSKRKLKNLALVFSLGLLLDFLLKIF